MKSSLISNCEKAFIIKAISEGKRLDGRGTYDFRKLSVHFGNDRGLCEVHLGNTKVLAQVSCEIVVPAVNRPTDGMVYINADLSLLSAPYFDSRSTEYTTEINRLLERCILESKAVDAESLCIVAREKVWSVRVDAKVLNHDGNLIDCLSIAVIAALVHFRRPDVTISGEDVTIHTLEERNPVPLSIHHWPICMTFAFFEDGKYLLVDPTEREEQTMNGKAVLGVNGLREICTWHMSGTMSLVKDQILRCAQIATSKATEIIDTIKTALAVDAEKRASGNINGFTEIVQPVKIISAIQEPFVVDVEEAKMEVQEVIAETKKHEKNRIKSEKISVITKAPGTAAIGLGEISTWILSDDDVEEVPSVANLSTRNLKTTKSNIETVELSDDSEEEAVMMLD
ncbi:Exosome complex component RRP45 [Chamberlinius hualienensis]